MEESNDSNHQIKLTIKEGRNFETILRPTVIVASLSNHLLETTITPPDSNPHYFVDLVWEVEKKSLRLMRSGHTPLKIQCFAVNESGNREKIGFVLLSVRTAQIISKNEDVEIRYNWHPLLGLKGDAKASKPELLLSLVIQDHNTNISRKKNNQESLSYQMITPVLLEHEHLIQLGPIDSCRDLFLITIMAGIVNNLDILMKESVLNENMDDVIFWYHIMDNDISLNPLKKSSERQWIQNQKISIRIRSSLAALRNYFQIQPYLLIFLKYKDNIIAQSRLDVRPLIFTDCLNEFVKKTQNSSTCLEQQCILLNEGEQFNANEPRASISIKFKVQHVDKKYEHSQFPKIPPQIAPPKNTPASNSCRSKEFHSMTIDSHRNCAGDYAKVSQRNSETDTIMQGHQYTNFHNFIRTNEELTFTNDCTKNIENFHCYCLNVYLIAFKLFPTCPSIRNLEFRFHHPKAEIMSTVHPSLPINSGGRLCLQNVCCKLHFISSVDDIKNLLISYPPKVSVCDDNVNAKTCIAQALLEVKKLFEQYKPECEYEAPLFDTDGNQVGILDVIMNLEDHGPYYNNKNRNSEDNLGPPILDDSLVYKIVDELENWKEKQKELFRMELRNKEEQYLNLLGEEWRKKKETLEAKLADSAEQCKMLANSLNQATEDLRIRRLKSFEKETRLVKLNEDLKNKYEMKIQDLRMSSEKMHTDFAKKLTLFEECKTSYEYQIDSLKRENDKLRQQVKSLDKQIMEYEKGLINSEQVDSLQQELLFLQEKLSKAEESKNYYKNQWSVTTNELQKVQSEYERLLEVQIKNSKEKRKNVEYEDILSANTDALLSDRILLVNMKKSLEMNEPKSLRVIKSAEQSAVSLNSLLSKPSQSQQNCAHMRQDEEVEAKLNKLAEQKEALLKTGSYHNDDPILVKLDNEMKALLQSQADVL